MTPDQCREFLQDTATGAGRRRVIVQPSSHRIFSNQDYINAGATIQESLHDSDVVLGYVNWGRVFLFFFQRR